MNKLKAKLKNNEFVKIVEALPPTDSNTTPILNNLKEIKNNFDIVSVVDNPRGIVHMSQLACSHLIQENGVETIMHISCTNKNRVEIQSQILGAEALGIKNLLFVTGDHVLSGENREARPVYDIDSILAIKIAKKLSKNLFMGACANHLSGELQLKSLEKKADVGARFIMTQPVYDIVKFKSFIEKIKKLDIGLYFIAGIMPLKSVKHAEFINNKIPGIHVPDGLIERLKNSKKPHLGGIKIANETIGEIKKIKEISGVNIMGVMDLKMINELEI